MSASASSISVLPANPYFLPKKRAMALDCAMVLPSYSKTGSLPNLNAAKEINDCVIIKASDRNVYNLTIIL